MRRTPRVYAHKRHADVTLTSCRRHADVVLTSSVWGADDMLTEEQHEMVESAAEMLYGLIHVRDILTSRGMNAMVRPPLWPAGHNRRGGVGAQRWLSRRVCGW